MAVVRTNPGSISPTMSISYFSSSLQAYDIIVQKTTTINWMGTGKLHFFESRGYKKKPEKTTNLKIYFFLNLF